MDSGSRLRIASASQDDVDVDIPRHLAWKASRLLGHQYATSPGCKPPSWPSPTRKLCGQRPTRTNARTCRRQSEDLADLKRSRGL